MTNLKCTGFLLALAVGLSSSSITLAQAVVDWEPAGTGDWNVDANWADVGFGNWIPEATYDDIAQINTGGTAQVLGPAPDVSGIQIVNGTVEVTATGELLSRVGDASLSSGDVTVSADGTLHVAGGGLMSVQAHLNLGGTFRVELTTLAQNPVGVTGRATLGGALVAEFNGATVTPGSTWNLIDATAFAGDFSSVSTSGVTLPVGQVFQVQQVSGGANGNLLQLGVDQRLVLNFDRGTGIASIENVGTSAVSLDFDSYLIESAIGSLDPGSWNSLQDQGYEDPGNLWAEAGSGAATMNALAEFNPRTSATLAPGESRQLGAIYAPNYLGVPFGAGTEDHVFTYTNNGQTMGGVVTYVGDEQYNNIVLTVDPVTGEATMQNESGRGVAIDSYTIASEDGGLLTTWNSLEDQGSAGGTWLEANPSANRLSELTEEGSTFLTQNAGFNLSTLFNTAYAQDLTFQFLIAGTTTVVDGVVIYGDLPTNIIPPGDFNEADFNQDGDIDQADLMAWESGFGIAAGAEKGDGDFDNDDDVDGSDFLGWQRNLGNGAAVATTAVPEPASLLLLLAGVVGLAVCRRGSR